MTSQADTGLKPLDQGTVWWPADLPAHDEVDVTFNRGFEQPPARVTCLDFATEEPLAVELAATRTTGTGRWARVTGMRVRFLDPTQRGRSFRWRIWAE